jgi:hypothetical protein
MVLAMVLVHSLDERCFGLRKGPGDCEGRSLTSWPQQTIVQHKSSEEHDHRGNMDYLDESTLYV